MGAKLVDFYEKAKEIGGLKGQMRMAVLTSVPSAKAKDASDSPDLIKKFEQALTQIKAEA